MFQSTAAAGLILKRRLHIAPCGQALGTLRRYSIDIWGIQVLGNATAEASLGSLLAPEERMRAQQLVSSADRCGFIAARALLRRMLLRPQVKDSYQENDGSAIRRYDDGGFGRPLSIGGIGFSLSHCGGTAVCAMAGDIEIGVDIEALDRAEALQDSRAAWLHTSEEAAIADRPLEAQTEELVRRWTLKEAFAKALGLGLVLPFGQVGFLLDPVRLVAAPGQRPPDWQFAEVRADTHYIALAAKVPRRRPIAVRFRLVTPEELLASD